MRRRIARILVTGAAATAAIVLSAGSAAADPIEPSSWTINPGGEYTATTTFTELVNETSGVSFTCTFSEATGELKSGPGQTNPLGTVATLVFEGCEGPLGPVTAVPNSLPYSINGYTYDADGEGDSAVPETVGYIGPVSVSVSMTGCAFDVVGNAPGAFDNDTSELRMGPPAALPPGIAPLAATNIVGCFGLVTPTDVLTYSGDYTVTPPQTITGQA